MNFQMLFSLNTHIYSMIASCRRYIVHKSKVGWAPAPSRHGGQRRPPHRPGLVLGQRESAMNFWDGIPGTGY